MRPLIRKHPLILVVSVCVIGLLVWGFWPQPVLIEAVEVKRAPMTITIEEEGRTRVIDRYVISAPMDGVACRVQLDVGDPVEHGQVLLYISPLQSQVLDARTQAQAEAGILSAEAALQSAVEQVKVAAEAEELAAKDLARLKSLVGQGHISREEYDKAVTAANATAAASRSAEFNVEVARYELEAARAVLRFSGAGEPDSVPERVPVTSPITGRILKIDHECEGPVQTGQPLLEVGDPMALEVEVDVLSPDAVKIHPGMKVRFARWGGEQALHGVVRVIEPVGFTKISALGVEEQRVLVISDFTSPQAEFSRLGDGYRVDANFIIWQEDDVLQVPASSLFRHNEGWAVFAVEEGRAVRRQIEVGQRNGIAAQILDGLSEGEQVVNHPGDEIEDGVPVREWRRSE